MNPLFKKIFSFSPSKKINHIGIDISDSAVKLIEVSATNRLFSITGCGIAPLPEGAVIANSIKNTEAVGQAILSAAQNANITADQAIIALPAPLVMTEMIQVNNDLSEEDIEIEVIKNAAHIVPYSIDDINMDFSVIGPTPNNEKTLDILYVAARSEFIHQRTAVLEIANLTPKAIDVESYAISRAAKIERNKLPNEGQDQIIAIVDIGATATTLTVLNNFNVIFCREEIFGGKQLTFLIQEKYDLSFAEAGLAKKKGAISGDYEQDVLNKFRETLVTHIMRTLEYFFSSTAITTIDCLLLAGGVVATPKLVESLEKTLVCPIFVSNPFEQLNLTPNVDRELIKTNQTSLMLTLGLALWGLPNATN